MSDVCGMPGLGGSFEAGVGWPMGDKLTLWAWASVLATTASSPLLTPMPALWVGLGW